jgi:hypothetical protein
LYCRQFVYYAIEKITNFPIRVPAYNTASSINARKMNARYMLVVQAILLPGTFHTCQAV